MQVDFLDHTRDSLFLPHSGASPGRDRTVSSGSTAAPAASKRTTQGAWLPREARCSGVQRLSCGAGTGGGAVALVTGEACAKGGARCALSCTPPLHEQ